MTEILLKERKTLTHPSIEISAIASRSIVLSKQRTIKALIRLHRCASVVRKCQNRFSHGVAQLYFHCKHKNNFSQQDNEPSNFESQTFKSPLIFAQSSKLPFEYCFLWHWVHLEAKPGAMKCVTADTNHQLPNPWNLYSQKTMFCIMTCASINVFQRESHRIIQKNLKLWGLISYPWLTNLSQNFPRYVLQFTHNFQQGYLKSHPCVEVIWWTHESMNLRLSSLVNHW